MEGKLLYLVIALLSLTAVAALEGNDTETPKPIILNEDRVDKKSIGEVHVFLTDPKVRASKQEVKDTEIPVPIIQNEERNDTETPVPIIQYETVNSSGNFVSSNDNVDILKDLPEPVHQEKDFELFNPTHVNGQELFERDIMLTPEQRALMAQRKAIITSLNYRWPEVNGFPYVPYIFGDTAVDQTAVTAGINHWKQHTCLTFGTATDLSAPHLRFIKGNGCWSYIGRLWTYAGQDVSIGQGCTIMGTVTHEIGHAIGFFHEQSRSDRDSYVYINSDNILAGYSSNFDRAADADVYNYSVPYDYSSDMHYGGTYFSKNEHLTLATKDPLAQELIGSRAGLSHRDKLLANRMYHCIDKWVAACGLSSDPCLNDGYLGADCNCVCPPGTNGTYCGTVTSDYYAPLLSGCSQKITAPTTISSPGYPNKYNAGINCVKWIVAPSCYKVQLTVNSFALYPKVTCADGNPCCYWDGLEIRLSDLYDGDWYCGQMISPGTTFTSDKNEMILYFTTGTNLYTGFTANVQFIVDDSDPTCSNITTTTPSTSTDSTDTSTTTTTAPQPQGPMCGLEVWNNTFYWSSPNFGIQNYPDNFECGLWGASSQPFLAVFKFQPMKLQPRVKNVCLDYVRFIYPYEVTKEFCGDNTGKTLTLPTFYLSALFFTDSSINRIGFNFSLQAVPSPCHIRYDLTTLGQTGVFQTPYYPKFDRQSNRMCELWFIAPTPYRVRLNFLGFNLKTPCKWNNVIINLQNDHQYLMANSTRYCGTALPPSMTSVQSEAYLLYMTNTKNKGFKVRYTVVQ